MPERLEQFMQDKEYIDLGYFLDPVTLFMGSDIISAINQADAFFASEGVGTKQIEYARLRLSKQGIALPLVRLRDLKLKPREFIIAFYDVLMYQEIIPDEEEISSKYMVDRLEETFRLKYDEFLKISRNRDSKNVTGRA